MEKSSSSLSASRWSRPAFLLLAATLSLASSATGAGTDAEAGSLDPRSLPGGGLHADLSMACGGCAATAHQLKHLLDRPPRDRLRETVQEWDERAGETREVPYHRSAKYVDDVLARVCARDSLARYRRRITWLGDVTWAVDDLPWDESARASRPVDDDLRAVCRRAVKHYRAELLDAVARRDPASACRNLGCGTVPPVHVALAETTWKLITDPDAMLRLAPVFVMAFVVPLLFAPLWRPPEHPPDASEALARIRRERGMDEGDARAGARKKKR